MLLRFLQYHHMVPLHPLHLHHSPWTFPSPQSPPPPGAPSALSLWPAPSPPGTPVAHPKKHAPVLQKHANLENRTKITLLFWHTSAKP
jgi:hypothetical protein